MIDLTKCLMYLRPGEQWTLNGDSYDGLVWLENTPKPTQEELESVWEQAQEQFELQKEARVQAKNSALSKLAGLGLTEEEISSLLNS